jgi:hypothetical protein
MMLVGVVGPAVADPVHMVTTAISAGLLAASERARSIRIALTEFGGHEQGQSQPSGAVEFPGLRLDP